MLHHVRGKKIFWFCSVSLLLWCLPYLLLLSQYFHIKLCKWRVYINKISLDIGKTNQDAFVKFYFVWSSMSECFLRTTKWLFLRMESGVFGVWLFLVKQKRCHFSTKRSIAVVILSITSPDTEALSTPIQLLSCTFGPLIHKRTVF